VRKTRRYHAIHEAGHAVVGRALGLRPKKLLVGRTSTGTDGSTEFCDWNAVNRNKERFLRIAVAGQVATRLLGYNNNLVSEELYFLPDGHEPGDSSDAWYVWDRHCYYLWEVIEAEREVRQMLQGRIKKLQQLAKALQAGGELNKQEIKDLLV
jgi:hypothetical protein